MNSHDLNERLVKEVVDLLAVEEDKRLLAVLRKLKEALPLDQAWPRVVYQVDLRSEDGSELYIHLDRYARSLQYSTDLDVARFRTRLPGRGYTLWLATGERSFADLAAERPLLKVWTQLLDWAPVPWSVLLRAMGLTGREREAFLLIHRDGMTHRKAAGLLGVTQSTVSTHVRNIRKKVAASPYQPLMGRMRHLIGVKVVEDSY